MVEGVLGVEFPVGVFGVTGFIGVTEFTSFVLGTLSVCGVSGCVGASEDLAGVCGISIFFLFGEGLSSGTEGLFRFLLSGLFSIFEGELSGSEREFSFRFFTFSSVSSDNIFLFLSTILASDSAEFFGSCPSFLYFFG